MIRVIQDVLIDRSHHPLAELTVGTLATTVHFYAILRADILKSYAYVVAAVNKIAAIYGEDIREHQIANRSVLQLWMISR